MRIRLAALALTALAGVSALAGCGVPLQSSAERLPANAVPAPLPTTSAPSPSEDPTAAASTTVEASATGVVGRLRLWFVQDDGLASAESDLPTDSPAEVILQSLAIGPTAVQVAEGLRTVARDPLTGMPLVSVASSIPTPATSPPVPASGPPSASPTMTAPVATIAVQLAPAFSALPSAEQILLLGQVVLSLTGAGESAVAFIDDAGAPVAVPLPDGRLLDVPATARDYNGLIVKP